MIIGCYSLHLYCDSGRHTGDVSYRMGQFTGENASEARRNARKDGWLIDRKANRAICPKCAKVGEKP